ncbi:hypothetical protein X801_09468, partial [Opisthorchis viverrini]
MPSSVDRRHNFPYTPNYCEENVYLLLEKLMKQSDSGEFHVVFVSNSNASVALFGQRKGDPFHNYVIVWDYHVFLIHSVHDEHWVYDFDAILEFPSSFADYCVHGLLENKKLPECLRRQYRVVPGSKYLAYFASDRRHMRRPDGEWIAPPPSYDCIRGSQADSPHTLPHYLNMNTRIQSEASCYGQILD